MEPFYFTCLELDIIVIRKKKEKYNSDNEKNGFWLKSQVHYSIICILNVFKKLSENKAYKLFQYIEIIIY